MQQQKEDDVSIWFAVSLWVSCEYLLIQSLSFCIFFVLRMNDTEKEPQVHELMKFHFN